MKTQQAEWFLQHDFTRTPNGTSVVVNIFKDEAHLLLASGKDSYRYVFPNYGGFQSKEQVDAAIADQISHFEHLLQSE